MKDLLLAVLAISMPFAFKIVQVLRDKKLQLKKTNELQNQFQQHKSTEN
jgi:hypothetical protein